MSFMLALALATLTQAPPTGDSKEDLAARLQIMKSAAASYDIRPIEGEGRRFRLQAEPVLRFNNPLGLTEDGGIFLWLSDGERPEVAAQIFKHRDGDWTHEFTSLSPGPLVGKTADAKDWRPARGGVEFKPIPGAPKPARSAEQRLRQMQSLAREFEVEDLFKKKSWQRLRMLTKPFARYGEQGGMVTDGALFAYVLTTDPEAFLMLEVRNGKAEPEWHFAFAPMTIFALKASWKGRQVWELPNRGYDASRPNQPFYFRENVPINRRSEP